MIGHDRVVVASTDISCVHFFASRDEQSHVVMGGKDQYNFRAARRKQVRVHTCISSTTSSRCMSGSASWQVGQLQILEGMGLISPATSGKGQRV